MKTIFKYELKLETNELRLPEGAQILTVDSQHGKPMLWALVDAAKTTEKRQIHIFGTGWPIRETNLKYISTFQLDGGALVFHAFE